VSRSRRQGSWRCAPPAPGSRPPRLAVAHPDLTRLAFVAGSNAARAARGAEKSDQKGIDSRMVLAPCTLMLPQPDSQDAGPGRHGRSIRHFQPAWSLLRRCAARARCGASPAGGARVRVSAFAERVCEELIDRLAPGIRQVPSAGAAEARATDLRWRALDPLAVAPTHPLVALLIEDKEGCTTLEAAPCACQPLPPRPIASWPGRAAGGCPAATARRDP